MSVFVWGLFGSREGAARAVDELIEGSFPLEEISVFLRDHGEPVEEVPIQHKTAAPHGAAIGATLGAAGAAVALAALPGGFLAAGPLLGAVQALVLAGVGGAAGGLAGIYWWKNEPDIPTDAVAHGAVLVGVTVPEGRVDAVRGILQGAGCENAATAVSAPPDRFTHEPPHLGVR